MHAGKELERYHDNDLRGLVHEDQQRHTAFEQLMDGQNMKLEHDIAEMEAELARI